MIELYFLVEGQTEEEFVKKTLNRYLSLKNIYCHAKSFNGVPTYSEFASNVKKLFKQFNNKVIYITSMLDLYKLKGDYPKYEEALLVNDPHKKVDLLQEALKQSIDKSNHQYKNRFIPYYQLHEFEAMLFVDPGAFSTCGCDITSSDVAKLWKIRQEFNDVELINSNKPPSKRIASIYNSYNKIIDGNVMLEEIGLERIRKFCSNFNKWINNIESLLK